MVQMMTMMRILGMALLLALPVEGYAQSIPFSWNSVVSSTSGGGTGNVSGTGSANKNAYWSTSTTLTYDNAITDNGTGGLQLANVSATGTVSATMFNAAQGSASVVGYGFDGGTTTGLFRTSGPTLNMAANGATVVTVGSGQVAIQRNLSLVASGTAGTANALIQVSGTAIITSNVAINSTTAPTYPLTVDGLTAAAGTDYVCWSSVTKRMTTGSTCTVSDEVLKKNITRSPYGLAEINRLEPATYEFKSKVYGDGYDIGLIAEDVQKVVPQAVEYGDDGIAAVRYHVLVPVLISAVQELDAGLRQLEAKPPYPRPPFAPPPIQGHPPCPMTS